MIELPGGHGFLKEMQKLEFYTYVHKKYTFRMCSYLKMDHDDLLSETDENLMVSNKMMISLISSELQLLVTISVSSKFLFAYLLFLIQTDLIRLKKYVNTYEKNLKFSEKKSRKLFCLRISFQNHEMAGNPQNWCLKQIHEIGTITNCEITKCRDLLCNHPIIIYSVDTNVVTMY